MSDSENDPSDVAMCPAPDVALLHELYQTDLLPNRYDALMQSWGVRVEAAVDALPEDVLNLTWPLTDLPAERSPKHLDRSLQIPLAIDKSRGTARNTEDTRNRAKFARDPGGRAIWYNGRARDIFTLARNATLDA